MMVTHARTGSLRRVTPNGNATSSWAPRSNLHVTVSGSLFEQHRQQPHPAAFQRRRRPARSVQKRCAFLLRHASRHGHYGVVPELAAQLAEFAEAGIELVLGPLPHAARVDDDDVGV